MTLPRDGSPRAEPRNRLWPADFIDRVLIVRRALERGDAGDLEAKGAIIAMAAVLEMKRAIAGAVAAVERWSGTPDDSIEEAEAMALLTRAVRRCEVALSVANGFENLGAADRFAPEPGVDDDAS